MSWGEAVRQVQTLADDPSTRFAATLSGHKHPWTREWEALANLYDLTQNAHRFAKPQAYPRPWRPSGEQHGRTEMSRAEVIDILNARGHKIAN